MFRNEILNFVRMGGTIRAVLGLALLLLAVPVAHAQDLNGDGRVDAVFTQKQRYNQVCFGDGWGKFTTCSDVMGAGANTISNQINTTSSALIDFDRDGDLDIAFAMETNASVVCYNNGGGDFNSGHGCVPVFNYNTFPYFSQKVVAGDLDGDGEPDLLFANGGNPGLSVAQPNVFCRGFGNIATACHTFGTDAASTGMALGDMDGDGDLDVVVSNVGTTNEVCLNEGYNTGTGHMQFSCRAITPPSGLTFTNSNAVAVGRLAGTNGTADAILDVAFANTGRNEKCIGGGDWTFPNVGLTCYQLNGASTYFTADATARHTDVAIGNLVNAYAGDEIAFAAADSGNSFCFSSWSCTWAFQPTHSVTDLWFGTLVTSCCEPDVEVTTGVAVRDIDIDGKLDVVVANDGIDHISRTYSNVYTLIVANATLHPSGVSLSGGDTPGEVQDTTPPVLSGANNVTVEAIGPNGAVAQFNVTANDVADGVRPVTCIPASGSTFPLGNTTVTCTASDTAGNTGTATFLVTVRDTTPAAISVPANFSTVAPAGQVTTAVTFTVSAVDLVDGVLTPTCIRMTSEFGGELVTSGSQFPGGTWTVICSARDTRQNYAEASFVVTVTTDIDADGVVDDLDPDDDGDGIADVVDTSRTTVSNDYELDAKNKGTVTRNGWTVTIAPTGSGSAFQLRATLAGTGTAPAVITANCGGGPKELRLSTAGDSVDWRCPESGTSLTVSFVSGTPEFWKVICLTSCGWAKMTATSGNGVIAGSPVLALPENLSPVLVTILNDLLEELASFTLDSEESVDVEIVDGPEGEPVLQLELLNGGPDGSVTVTWFGQAVTLDGSGPVTLDLNPDLTPPVVAVQVTGTLGSNGFYTSDVTVSWTVTDDESAATTTGCGLETVSSDTNGVTFTCSATSEGGTTSESVTIKRDATVPTISGVSSPTPNGAGWNNTPVSVAFTCGDATSGVDSCTGSTTLSGEGPAQSVTGVVTDLAGNTASATVEGINVDLTAPVITVPANITVVAETDAGTVVTYEVSAQDNLSPAPAVSCIPAPPGSTFPIGTTIISCSASDLAGNGATRTFTVTVTEEADVTTPGHVTGGGFVRTDGQRYEFNFDVREGERGEFARFRLGVKNEKDKGKGRPDTFVSSTVTAVAFSDDPTYNPSRARRHTPGRPQVDTVLFSGTGVWNGEAGYSYEVYAEDQGEPGRHRESVRITISRGSTVVAFVEGELSGGNIQSVRIRH